jgi:hypothetical protein
MSYEFNPKSANLDFPNPFAVENYFLFTAAALQCLGALVLLLICRQQIERHNGASAVLPILVGVGLLVSGLNHARRAMMQLRFFFGRSQPFSLAPDLSPGDEGTTPAAEFLKRTVRQHAIDYPVPTGPLNGVLYSWIPNLIFSPAPIQRLAQRQLHNALAILVTLISFLISWVGFSSAASAAWMGLFYFGFSLFLLLRPLESTRTAEAEVGTRAFVILVLCAVFGPVLVPIVAAGLPNITWLSLGWQTLFLLVASIVGVGLFFRALLCQMNTPPQTNPALEQISLSMNCHPSQLIDELDRKLQQEWTEQIPNRRYCKISPVVSGSAGSFQGELLEETQPMPAEHVKRIDFSSAFSVPKFVWIAALDLLGVTLIAIAVLSLLAFASKTQLELGPASMAAYLTLGVAGLTLGGFCLRVGHPLWGRFDFKSQLIWVTMEGNYQAAKLAFGNQFTDRIKTQKQVINIETMTLRVWVAELHTVIFDTNSPRFLIALRGLPKRASELSSHLSRFAGEQSIIVSPTANADLQKSALLGTLNGVSDSVNTRLQRSLMNAVLTAQTDTKRSPVSVNSETVRCEKCSAPAPEGDRFCSMCGSVLSLLVPGGDDQKVLSV